MLLVKVGGAGAVAEQAVLGGYDLLVQILSGEQGISFLRGSLKGHGLELLLVSKVLVDHRQLSDVGLTICAINAWVDPIFDLLFL